jgi:hypothetical protein
MREPSFWTSVETALADYYDYLSRGGSIPSGHARCTGRLNPNCRCCRWPRGSTLEDGCTGESPRRWMKMQDRLHEARGAWLRAGRRLARLYTLLGRGATCDALVGPLDVEETP